MRLISIFKMLRKPSKVISLRIRAYNEGKWVGAFSGAIILSQIVPIKSLLAKLSHINWHKVSKRSPSRHFRYYRIYPETKLYSWKLNKIEMKFSFLSCRNELFTAVESNCAKLYCRTLRNENFWKIKINLTFYGFWTDRFL